MSLGAIDNSYASAFVKQMGDVLEYLLYLPMMLARLAFAAGATHRLGQLLEVCNIVFGCSLCLL